MTLYGYQRGLMDAMCDPTMPVVTVPKGVRVGYTRCATLALAYYCHHDPMLCAVVQPTLPDAEDFGGGEIAPMLRVTPVLCDYVRPIRFRVFVKLPLRVLDLSESAGRHRNEVL